MRFFLIRISVAVLFAIACEPACADGGQVRTVERHGNNEITVFTSPTPMCAGWADISVVIQSTVTGEVCEDVQIIVKLKHRDPIVPVISKEATTQAATNKLLRAALVELPEQGIWDVTVYVLAGGASKSTETHFTMNVAAPWPTWMTEWPWFIWPVVPILLFIVHRILVAARSRGRGIGECSRAKVSTTRIAPSNLASRT
jgi:hypothetical protein